MSRWRFDDCPRLTVEGRWWRMLSPRWHHDPLSGTGAARNGGRWNAKGMSALYLSATHATAIAEYMQALIHPGTLTPYDVASGAILDLTDATVRKQVGVDEALLRSPWRLIRDVERREPETWAFGRQACEAGFEGLRAGSMQGNGANLVLWRWGVEGANVSVVDPQADLAAKTRS